MSVQLPRPGAARPRPAEPPLLPSPELTPRSFWRRWWSLIAIGGLAFLTAEIALLGRALQVW